MAHYRVAQIEDYEPLVGAEVVERICDKAAKLKGLRVAHFNSTYYGGGVAETISSLTLLMNSLGLRTEWRVIQGTSDFFSITKKMHNALQGGEIDLSKIKKEIFERRWIDNYDVAILSCKEFRSGDEAATKSDDAGDQSIHDQESPPERSRNRRASGAL